MDDSMVTVVIPTLNEERALPGCLASVGHVPGVEVVVSDGGSDDRTLTIAHERPGTIVVNGARGRGAQLHRGAAAASGRILLFLHADCRLPRRWLAAVEQALEDPGVSLACFRLATRTSAPAGDGRRFWLRLLDVRSYLGRLPYGDQGFALRRDTYRAVGGFQPIPLMEDVAMARDCRRLGRIHRIPLAVQTTARRFERRPFRTRAMTLSFPWLYRLGVDPNRLARWYGAVR